MSRNAIRANRRVFHVRVESETARDEEMSYRALGLLTHILSHTDEWAVRSEQLARAKKREGRDAVRKALHELASRGYYRLERRRFRDGTVVMGTAVSEFSVEQWAKDYVTFGGKLDIPIVEQADGSFLVRYPDGTLGSDGFVPGPADKGAREDEEPVRPAPEAQPEEAPAPAAAPARPQAAPRAAAVPTPAPRPARARKATAKTAAAEEKAADEKALDDAAEKVAKWWWEHAKTHLGPYVGAKNGYVALRKQIRSALAANYSQMECGRALQHARKHWPSAQQWQDALGVVTNHIQPQQRTGRIAYSDAATWGTSDPASAVPTDTDENDATFGVLTD